MPAYTLVGGNPNKKTIIPDKNVEDDFSIYLENIEVAERNLHQLAENIAVVHEHGEEEARDQIDGRNGWGVLKASD